MSAEIVNQWGALFDRSTGAHYSGCVIAEFGTSCLLLIPSVALYSLGMTWLGARYRDARSFRSGVLAIYVIALLATAAQALSVAPFFFEAAAGPWYAPLLAAWNSVVGGLLGCLQGVHAVLVRRGRQIGFGVHVLLNSGAS